MLIFEKNFLQKIQKCPNVKPEIWLILYEHCEWFELLFEFDIGFLLKKLLLEENLVSLLFEN
jgi:hypothetical protein